MLLITFNEWFGPTYQEARNSKYLASAINYTLLTVVTIDYLNPDVREKMNIQLIEDLPTTVDEIL